MLHLSPLIRETGTSGLLLTCDENPNQKPKPPKIDDTVNDDFPILSDIIIHFFFVSRYCILLFFMHFRDKNAKGDDYMSLARETARNCMQLCG